ncbi:MAG TPA: hypothetical protein VF480_04835, partial [Verrucomicrobiae bacterium]
LHESTMNGALDSATGPATAERAMAKRQSGSPANWKARDFFGIIGLEHPRRMQECMGKIQTRRQRGKIYFQKSLVSLARRIKFILPNENWAPRRVLAI